SAAALWEAHRSEQNRLIAERRFNEARRLVYTVIHDIQPKMADLNGSVELRVLMIEKTLVYLEALQKDASGNPALMRELIDGYVELAGVAGSVVQPNVGQYQRASEILEKARSLGDQLQRAAPTDRDCLQTLAALYRASAMQRSNFGED